MLFDFLVFDFSFANFHAIMNALENTSLANYLNMVGLLCSISMSLEKISSGM